MIRADDVRVACPLFHEGCGGSIPTSALQLRVVSIARIKFVQLNELWHSRLPICQNCFEGKTFGAVFDNVFYAVAWWSKPIASNRFHNAHQIYELRRMAVCSDAPANTASRILRVMKDIIKKEMPEICRLISYQDTAVHTGTIYRAAGWVPASLSKFATWKNRSDYNRIDQSSSDKLRWECQIRVPPDENIEDSHTANNTGSMPCQQVSLDF